MSRSPSEPIRTHLTASRSNASARIRKQIEEAEGFLPAGERLVTRDDLFAARRVWSDYTIDLLKTLFTTDELAKEFETSKNIPFNLSARPAELFRHAVDQTKRQVDSLRSIDRRLEFFEELSDRPPEVLPNPIEVHTDGGRNNFRDVFIVHGHQSEAKEAVARFLEKLMLNPIILHEQADQGRTIIQKFEDHSVVGFAVVLLTPDDEGRMRGAADLLPRAPECNPGTRILPWQARPRTSLPLKVAGVEEPSDLDGVLYIPFDPDGGWKPRLARELKAAGFDVDMNRAV